MRRGEYFYIAELLRDMELEVQTDIRCDISDVTTNTLRLTSQPNQREVPHLLSWGQCFGCCVAATLLKYSNSMHIRLQVWRVGCHTTKCSSSKLHSVQKTGQRITFYAATFLHWQIEGSDGFQLLCTLIGDIKGSGLPTLVLH